MMKINFFSWEVETPQTPTPELPIPMQYRTQLYRPLFCFLVIKILISFLQFWLFVNIEVFVFPFYKFQGSVFFTFFFWNNSKTHQMTSNTPKHKYLLHVRMKDNIKRKNLARQAIWSHKSFLWEQGCISDYKQCILLLIRQWQNDESKNFCHHGNSPRTDNDEN